jgi:hypothetical protein
MTRLNTVPLKLLSKNGAPAPNEIVKIIARNKGVNVALAIVFAPTRFAQ